jgi:heptosyltransferase-2
MPFKWVETFSHAISGSIEGRPDFRFLLSSPEDVPTGTEEHVRKGQYYYAMMPDSAWAGKCWPIERYLEVAESLKGGVVLVLGTKRDRQAAVLIEQLKLRGMDYRDERGLSWPQLSRWVSRCEFLVGNDTGLTHLAEAVGTPVVVIFGPTAPELGFAPLDPRSRAVGADVRCRPCSTDGRHCYWIGENRYQCLKNVSVDQVRGACLEVLRTRMPRAVNDAWSGDS